MRKMMVAALAVAALGVSSAAWAQANNVAVGSYSRPNGDAVEVYECGGQLCGRIVGGERDGFEMLHGMDATGANEWRGNRMKHPGMPGFMTFNGTVTRGEDGSLSVRGCAIGQSFCDAETWSPQS